MSAAAEDRYAVVCNLAEPDAVGRAGAKAWVTPVALAHRERIVVLVRSRGGRHAERWMAIAKLRDFRVTTVPPAHPRALDPRIDLHASREDAQAVAESLSEVPARLSGGAGGRGEDAEGVDDEDERSAE